MEQIKNVGVVEGKMEADVGYGVLHIDPAKDNAEETARVITENTKAGKSTVIVLGNANAGEITRRLIAELEEHESIDDVVRDIWQQERPRGRRVGILGGAVHMALEFLSSAHGPNSVMGCFLQEENYFDYRQRIREEEIARQIRRPPKKAICSSRRRGRKFKG